MRPGFLSTAFLILVLFIFHTCASSTALANDWLIEKYGLTIPEINSGMNSVVSRKKMIPVGLDVLNNQLYVHYVPNSLIDASEWTVQVYKTVPDFNSGVDKFVAQGFIPVDVTVFSETMLALFLKTPMKIDSWKWITTGPEGKDLAAGVNKLWNLGYAPTGITSLPNAFGLIMIRPVNQKVVNWQLCPYSSRDVAGIKKELLREMAAGSIPFGLLAGNKVTNVLLLRIEKEKAESKKPASQKPSKRNRKPSKPEVLALKPVDLLNEVSEFLTLLRADLRLAANIYVAPGGKAGFDCISTLCGPALKYFAHGCLPMIRWLSPHEAMVGLYHPWADLMLLTEWRANEYGAIIHSLELVTGDFIRNNGEPPYQVLPLWRLPGQGLPPEALRKSVSETATAFHSIFREALGNGRWRLELQAFRNPELLTANSALGALGLSRILRGFQSLARDTEKRALAREIEKTMTLLSKGGIGNLNLKGGKDHLKKASTAYWSQAQIMDLVTGRDGALVFLNSPGSPWHFVSLLFDLKKGGAELQRVDLIDLPFEGGERKP